MHRHKTPIDKFDPLYFFKTILEEKGFKFFVNSLYPIDAGDDFRRGDNGDYSFLMNSQYYDENNKLVDIYFKGNIYNDMKGIFQFHLDEIKTLLEKRRQEYLFESRKADDKYQELLINQIDSLLSKISFIKNPIEHDIVTKGLTDIRRELYDSLNPKAIVRPIDQKHIDYLDQRSFLLGEIKLTQIERIYEVAIEDERYDLLEVDKNSLDDFMNIFSSSSPNKVNSQIFFEPDRLLVTAFILALKEVYPHFTLKNFEASNAFFYREKSKKLQIITESSLRANKTRYSKSIEFIKRYEYYKKLIGDTKH